MEFKADAPTWYAAVLGGLLSLLLALRLVHLASVILYSRLRPGALARFIYSKSPPPFRSFSRLAVMFGLAYIASNAVPLAVGTGSLEEAGSRAGLMALANLVFLTLGPLSLVAGCFGWSLVHQRRLHACVGFVASLEVLVHVVVAISLDGFHLSRANIFGIAVRELELPLSSTLSPALANSGLGGCSCRSLLLPRHHPPSRSTV